MQGKDSDSDSDKGKKGGKKAYKKNVRHIASFNIPSDRWSLFVGYVVFLI
jgi:hypothetical protein